MFTCWPRKVGLALLLAGLVALSGCGTLVSSYYSWPDPNFYGGTRLDIDVASAPQGGALVLFDLPGSAVVDTALLPLNTLLWMLKVQVEFAQLPADQPMEIMDPQPSRP